MVRIFRIIAPKVRTFLSVGVGLASAALISGCGPGKGAKKTQEREPLSLKSCLEGKSQEPQIKKPRIIIKEAPEAYRKSLNYGDMAGDFDGEINSYEEARISLEEFCRSKKFSDCREFLDYIWGRKLGWHQYFDDAEFGLHVILRTAPFNWSENQIDFLISKVKNISKDWRFSRELIKVLPHILEGSKKGNRPKEVLKRIKSITNSITFKRFDSARMRYGERERTWAEVVKNRVVNRPDGRPLAVVIYPNPRTDYNKYFEDTKGAILELMNNGYRVMYYEVSTDKEFYAKLKEATKKQKARIILIGGHGTRRSTNLGRKDHRFVEYYYIDLTDKKEMIKGNIGATLEDGGQIILESCSTGRGREKGDNLANLFYRKIFTQASLLWSPDKPSVLGRLIFKNRRLVDVESPDTYDPVEGRLECPGPKWRKEDRFISIYLNNLKIRPPRPGIKNEFMNYLWCMATSGNKVNRKKIVKGLIGLLKEERAAALAAKETLRQIAIKESSSLGQLIGKKKYLPQIFAAWKKGNLAEGEALELLDHVSSFWEFIESLIKDGKPIKNIHILKAALTRNYFGRKFLEALLITATGYKGKSIPQDCNEAYSSVAALAYSILLEKERENPVSMHVDLKEILLDKKKDKRARRAAARILGDVRDKESKNALKKILGIGLLNFRDKDEELCRIAFESLRKIRGSK